MSHEIRTPMNGVLGMMEVVDRQGLSASQQRTVATMRDSAQALLRIIDDVLDFSKIEAGRLELEAAPFSLSGLIDGVLSTFQAQGNAKGLMLTGSVEPGSDDTLIGDATRVRQILFNLLGNALKFTERGRVTVNARTAPLGGGRTPAPKAGGAAAGAGRRRSPGKSGGAGAPVGVARCFLRDRGRWKRGAQGLEQQAVRGDAR